MRRWTEIAKRNFSEKMDYPTDAVIEARNSSRVPALEPENWQKVPTFLYLK